jgi:hypothetical protein
MIFTQVKVKCVFLFVFVFGFVAPAQLSKSLKKGYEALSIHDYFKAKHLFYQSFKQKASFPSAYGLSVIFSRKDNPFYQTDSASKYAQSAKLLFTKPQQNSVVSGFTLDSTAVEEHLKRCIQMSFDEAIKAGNIEQWDYFLEHHTLASEQTKTEAVYRRDELELNQVIAKNQSKITAQFLMTHPGSQLYDEALQLHERQLYDETCSNKTAQELNSFLKGFPKSRMRNTALEELYRIYRKNMDAAELAFFVSTYPQAPQANEAWKLLFALSVRSYSDEELIRFLAMYPEFPLRTTILKELQFSSYRFLAFQNEEAYGYMDTSGTIRIPANYDAVSSFKEELAVVSRNDSVWFINKVNENVFQQVFDDAFGFNAGAAPVKFNGTWKFINRQGQVISPEYEEINELSDNLYVLKTKGKYGALDRFGQSRVEARYDYLGNFTFGIATYREGEKYGFLSLTGYVHKAEFDWLSEFDEWNLAVFRKGSLFGLIHTNGQVKLAADYDQVLRTEQGVYVLVKNMHYGFYSAEGCFLSALEFDYQKEHPPHYYVQKNWFRLVKNKSMALMDANGALRVNYGVYEDLGFFNDGLLRVKKKKKYGFVDRKLQTLIPYHYTWAEDFADSVALVKKGELYEGINVAGRSLYNSPFKIQRVQGRYFLIETPEGKQLRNARGQLLLEQIEHYEALETPYAVFTLKNGEIKLLKL